MKWCFECKYCRADKELAKVDPDPWICTITGDRVDPENGHCTMFISDSKKKGVTQSERAQRIDSAAGACRYDDMRTLRPTTGSAAEMPTEQHAAVPVEKRARL